MKDVSLISNEPTMSSREIAELTGKQVGHIHRDFKALAAELDFPREGNLMPTPNVDLGFTYEFDSQNRISSINFNQELTLTLVSGYNAKLRNAIIKRWQELEANQAPTPPAFQIPQTLAEALQLAADQAKQLELQAPKVAFVEKLVERENLLNATQVAQPHKLSAVKLNRILDDVGGIYNKSVKRGRAFCQAWIDAGYGELKVTESGHNQCLFTVKGEQRINEILISEGIV